MGALSTSITSLAVAAMRAVRGAHLQLVRCLSVSQFVNLGLFVGRRGEIRLLCGTCLRLSDLLFQAHTRDKLDVAGLSVEFGELNLDVALCLFIFYAAVIGRLGSEAETVIFVVIGGELGHLFWLV